MACQDSPRGWPDGPGRPARPRPSWRLALLCLAAPMLQACGFPGPASPAERASLESCRTDADRIYNAQNRYQLSERSSTDSPFSGGSQPATPSDGLADQYGHEQMIADCMKRSAAVPVSGSAADNQRD